MLQDTDIEHRLLKAMAEELKLPLLNIARQAELHEVQHPPLSSIRQAADMSLKLLDGYILGLDTKQQQSLLIEPVSVSSVLYDTAQALTPLARQYDCDLELAIEGKYGPVMVDRRNLEMALLLLGYEMIGNRGIETERHRLLMAVRRGKRGLITGIFDNQHKLDKSIMRRGRALVGSARQPMPGAMSGSGASIFIASSLLQAMAAPLRLTRHQGLSGLAATLTLSKQLQLV